MSAGMVMGMIQWKREGVGWKETFPLISILKNEDPYNDPLTNHTALHQTNLMCQKVHAIGLRMYTGNRKLKLFC